MKHGLLKTGGIRHGLVRIDMNPSAFKGFHRFSYPLALSDSESSWLNEAQAVL